MKILFLFQRYITGILLSVVCFSMNGFGQSTLTLNIDQAVNVIPKEMYGVLMERLARCVNGGLYVGKSSTILNINGMRTDIVRGFKEAGVGSILYPGGCAGNGYNWQPTNPSNDLGTDQYMELCDSVGCPPYLCGRPTAGDATSNLNWVTYINNNASHPNWVLKYFKIGNEVWGCGGSQTEATYRSNYTANYNVLNNPVNGKKLFLVAGTDLIGKNAWLDTMLKYNAAKIDGIEVHDYLYFPDTYPCITFTDDQYWDIVNRAGDGQMAPRITEIKRIMDKYDPGKRIKIMEDEWGDWLMDIGVDGWMQQITVMDALSTGITLHVLMQNSDRILVASLAQAINVIHSLFLTRQSDGVLVKTPAFYVYKMFIPHHTANAKHVPGTLTSEKITGGGKTMSVISSVASVDESGNLNVSFTNVDPANTKTVKVTINGGSSAYSVKTAQVVTGPAKNSYNDFGKAETVNIQTLSSSNYSLSGKTLSVTLPSKSISMVVLTPSPCVGPGCTGTIGTGETLQHAAPTFSVTARPNGALLVTSRSASKKPVTISLYNANGRSISTTLQEGSGILTLGNDYRSNGVFILKITGDGINLSKRVAMIR